MLGHNKKKEQIGKKTGGFQFDSGPYENSPHICASNKPL